MNKKYFTILKSTAVFIWLLAIFLFSNQVAQDSSSLSRIFVEPIETYVPASQGIATFLVRKSAHMFLYFILGIMVYSLSREFKLSDRKRILYSLLFVFLYAISDEFHQKFVTGRSSELRDVFIDSIAGLLGIFLCSSLYIALERRSDQAT
jgi:VanZ family protein